MQDDRFKIAVIGAGRMGTVHARNAAAHPALELACVAETPDGSAATLADALQRPVAPFSAALADPAIAGVVIASATATHLDFALAALAAGKAVFCEKPLDLDLARLRAHAGVFADAPLVVGFNRRFDPHFRALKARLDAGEIGTLETLSLISHDPAAPPPGFIPTSGGLFRDFVIHDFDMARWLMGEEPVEVFAWASCLVDPAIAAAGDVDTARIVLKTTSGRLCTISSSRRSGYGYDQRAEVYGSAGMARVDNPRSTTLEGWSEAGSAAARIAGGFAERYAAAYAAEMDHFAAVLAGEAAPAVGHAANERALALAEAAGRSAQSGAPVMVESV
ncbi:MAG TPA: inositol 2-dehydrogenase [Caulobacteraceae bacterium]|nr:inositol 2-dehydrogenase [Caulobacteraceae bacterium]